MPQRQIRAACAAARKEGCIAVIEFGNTVLKLIPAEHVLRSLETERVDEPEDIRL